MYSLVLMAALTTGGSQPAFCHGCHGCCGCYSSCCGCYSSYGCCGCYSGYGCCGCYGGYSYGGYGCCSCYGGYSNGGYGCCSCYGGYSYGGYGCCSCYSGYGCYGCNGCCGGWAPAYITPPGPVVAPTAPESVSPPKPGAKVGEAMPARAKLIVEVPADAKLYIDDQPMKTKAARRVFNTPALEAGQAYYYVVRVEVVRDGKTLAETKRVIVRAGEEAKADFANMEAVAAAKAEATGGR